MHPLLLALALAWAGSLPAAAQGLRASPQLGTLPSAVRPVNEPRTADYIVAVVNSEPITNNELRSRLIRFEQQLAQMGAPMPSRPELARQVLERLISEKAQLQLARESGIRVDDALVDAAEQNVAAQNQVSVAELRRRLRADGIDPTQFREGLRDQLMLSRLRDRELDARVRVTELDVDQYLRDQQAGGDPSSIELNLSHILVEVPENPSDQQVRSLQQRAQQVVQRARAGEDFGKLARELSDAADVQRNGGVIGLRTMDRYPPLFVDATRDLRVGDISEAIRSAAGFHILKVEEKRAVGMPGVTVTQSRARHILLRPGGALTESAARERLADFKVRVESGLADFAQLAREFSQDASARDGGDLGWANPGLFVPEFEDALDALQPGQIADPVTSRFGVHLIQLIDRRQATLSERDQREIARNLVREKKLDEAYSRWAQEVRGRAFVELREPPQ